MQLPGINFSAQPNCTITKACSFTKQIGSRPPQMLLPCCATAAPCWARAANTVTVWRRPLCPEPRCCRLLLAQLRSSGPPPLVFGWCCRFSAETQDIEGSTQNVACMCSWLLRLTQRRCEITPEHCRFRFDFLLLHSCAALLQTAELAVAAAAATGRQRRWRWQWRRGEAACYITHN